MKMKNLLTKLFIIIIILSGINTQTNLICNGDFEIYSLNNPGYSKYQKLSINYTYIADNSSCWYAKLKNFMQVKQFLVSNKFTNVVDLISSYPYWVCQNLLLIPNNTYELKFNFIIDQCHQQSTVFFLFNNKSIYNITSKSSIIPQLGVLKFKPKQAHNTACFKSDNKWKSSTPFLDRTTCGPVLDNVSLTEIIINPSQLLSMTLIDDNLANVTIIQDSSNTNFNNETSSEQQEQLIIQLKTFWNSNSGILYLYSNCNLLQEGLMLSIFNFCVVQINGEVIEQTIVKLDKDGYLFVQTQPQTIYSTQMDQTIKIYVPDQILLLSTNKKIFFKINGKQMDQNSLQGKKTMQIIQPIMSKMSLIVKRTFALLNVFYCSYFIINVIEFWNLTLLYNFLAIESIPKFTQSFFSKMNNFFFSYNSFSMQINKLIRQKKVSEQIINFDKLNQQQKIVAIKNNHVWFAFVGSSSNFTSNNFDCLILLTFFVFKCFLLKKLIKILKQKYNKSIQIKNRQFLNQFQKQLICFTPFIIISALQVLKYLGQNTLLGKLNNFLQISIVYFILFVACLNLINVFKYYRLKKQNNKQVLQIKINNKQKYQQITSILLNILVPTFILFQTKIGFFLIVTIIILFKISYFVFYLKFENFFSKIIRTISNLSWIVFHLSYFAFFIIQQITKRNMYVSQQFKNDLGFTVIFCFIIGGLFDILEFIVNFLIFIYKGIVELYYFCKKPKEIFVKAQKFDQGQSYFPNKILNQITQEKIIQNSQRKIKTVSAQLSKKKNLCGKTPKTILFIPASKSDKQSFNQLETVDLQTRRRQIRIQKYDLK